MQECVIKFKQLLVVSAARSVIVEPILSMKTTESVTPAGADDASAKLPFKMNKAGL